MLTSLLVSRFSLFFSLLLISKPPSIQSTKCRLTCHIQKGTHHRTKYTTFFCHWIGSTGQKPLRGCEALDERIMANVSTDNSKCPNLKNCFRPHAFAQTSDVSFYAAGLKTLGSDFLSEFPSLQKIIFFNNSISRIGTEAFKFSRLRYIDLNRNEISEITTQFQNLTVLNVINLSWNRLRRLPFDAFSGVKRLRTLFLTGNRLRTLDFLGDLTRLKILYLETDENVRIKMEDFPPFQGLEHARFKFLFPVNLTSLPGFHKKLSKITVFGFGSLNDSFFAEMPNVRVIRLHDGNVGGITSRLLSNLTRLEILRMENLGMSFVERGAFERTRSLQSMSLRHNQLDDINDSTFVGLEKLNYLDLSFNRLTSIETLSHLQSVKMLNVSFNQLQWINRWAFVNTSVLQYLNLEGNNLSVLHLPRMDSLNVLILDNNSFTGLSRSLMKNLIGLEKISFLYNPLERIHRDTFKHAQIVDISFGCCSDSAGRSRLCLNSSKIAIEEETFLLYNLFSKNRQLRRLRLLGCCENLRGNYLHIYANQFISRWNHRFWRSSLGNLHLFNVGNDAVFDLSNNGLFKINFRQFPDLTAKLLDFSNNELQIIDPNAFIDSEITTIKLNGNNIKTLSLVFNQRLTNMYQYIEAGNCSLQSFSILGVDEAVTQYLQIDMSYNRLTMKNFTFTGYKHFGVINLTHNNITSMTSSASIFNASTIDTLDISFNALQELPVKIKKMRHTTFKTGGNRWECSKCNHVALMVYANEYMDVFGFRCRGNVSMESVHEECLIEEKYVPYSLLAIFLAVSGIKLSHSINLVRLKRKHRAYQKVSLGSFKARNRFVSKSRLHQSLNHDNILRLHGFGSEIDPKSLFAGFLFVETRLCDLGQAIRMHRENRISLDPENLCLQLLKGIHFLHASRPPVYHLDVTTETVFIVGKHSGWTLKVGNFSKAESPKSRDECYESRDLHAVARIVSETGPKSIEFRVLIASLRRGLSASDSLKSPAFSPRTKRAFMLQQLSETLTGWSQMSPKALSKISGIELVERNSTLVVGGDGSWNRLFRRDLLDQFGCRGKGYKIVKVGDLIKIVRNIISHAKQHQDVMLRIFGSTAPTDEEFDAYFSNLFPYLHLHSLLVYEKIENPESFADDVYLREYSSLETEDNDDQLDNGAVRPLIDASSVRVEFFYFHPETLDPTMVRKAHRFHEGDPRTKVEGSEVAKRIKADLKAIWPETSTDRILAKNYRGENILDKRQKSNSKGEEASQGVPVLEGSTVEVAKMEALIQSTSLPLQETGCKFLWDFGVKSNVGDLKAAFDERLEEMGVRALRPEELKVSLDGKSLKDEDVLVKIGFYREAFKVEISSESALFSSH